MNQSTNRHKQKQGFSLVELLVVMAILATLMGLVIGVSGSVQRNAAVAKARAEIADLMNELEIYKTDKGEYPAGPGWAEFGDWYSNEKYRGTEYTITDGSPIDPIDPWGRDYIYDNVREFTYRIGSTGPDGQPGSSSDSGDLFGDGDDITNRNGAL